MVRADDSMVNPRLILALAAAGVMGCAGLWVAAVRSRGVGHDLLVVLAIVVTGYLAVVAGTVLVVGTMVGLLLSVVRNTGRSSAARPRWGPRLLGGLLAAATGAILGLSATGVGPSALVAGPGLLVVAWTISRGRVLSDLTAQQRRPFIGYLCVCGLAAGAVGVTILFL